MMYVTKNEDYNIWNIIRLQINHVLNNLLIAFLNYRLNRCHIKY